MTDSQTLTADELRDWRARVSETELSDDAAAMIDELRELETLKCAVEARQARLEAAFDTAERRRAAEAGEPVERQGRGVAAQIALARRVSPPRGQQLLGLARVLATELPHTMAAFRAGRVSEWRATILARETACLDLADRLTVDEALSADHDKLERRGDRELGDAARALAERLDNAAAAKRRARAEAERTVTIRPAPDLMTYVTALLPITQGVALYAALTQAADSARAAGDDRSRGQVMADTLLERATGRSVADPARIDLNLVMTDRALLADDDTPATLPGYGPVPAQWARETLTDAEVFLKRLFTHPTTGQLVAMDSTARKVPTGLAGFIHARDGGFCRNPYCGAPLRHLDHIRSWAEGGSTSADNLQGLCERCNHAKQAPGWQARPGPDGSIEITTPTGHTHRGRAPDPWLSVRPLVSLTISHDYVLTA